MSPASHDQLECPLSLPDLLTGYISISSNVLSELTHESAAELPDLTVRFSLGVEVCTTFPASHVQAGKSILEHLLEAEELEDGQVDRRMEAETTFVGSECGIELDSIATVHLDLALVIFPDDSELDDAFWDGGDLERFLVLRVLVEEGGVFECRGKLFVGLLELGLGWDVGHGCGVAHVSLVGSVERI